MFAVTVALVENHIPLVARNAIFDKRGSQRSDTVLSPMFTWKNAFVHVCSLEKSGMCWIDTRAQPG